MSPARARISDKYSATAVSAHFLLIGNSGANTIIIVTQYQIKTLLIRGSEAPAYSAIVAASVIGEGLH